jgi:YidC/Oxa1 family membrane protein insertase
MWRDTVALDTVPLRAETHTSGASPSLSYTGTVSGRPLILTYNVVPDSFLLRVSANVTGAPPGSALLIELPRTLRSNEPDTLEDIGHLAVSYRTNSGDIESVGFSKLDSTETRGETRPVSWLAVRNKYFLVAYRTPAKAPFTAIRLQGGGRSGKIANSLAASAVLPLTTDGRAGFDIYAGPQDFERLQKLGNDLDQVNPYGGFLRGVVQPFAVIVMRVLLWIKRTTHLNYGWVLVLFGVIIRLALWPLNQGAMRTSMKMQRLQPELQALQKRHSDDPRKQQEAIMKVYKEHGMSPLSPLMGCLPMLLPMPVLFALYFVFQNTIEFRGVSFLWLPDISLRDPYFITPILMGVSMFVMSWVGMRNSPPNPQAKMMMFMMPVMLTVLFFNFASGLNLYYAVQNIAAIPQQWLLAHERGKEPAVTAVVRGTPAPAQKGRT